MIDPFAVLYAQESRACAERSPKLSDRHRLVALDQPRPDHESRALGIAAHVEDDGWRSKDGIECRVSVTILQAFKIDVAVAGGQDPIDRWNGAIGRAGDIAICHAARELDVALRVVTL